MMLSQTSGTRSAHAASPSLDPTDGQQEIAKFRVCDHCRIKKTKCDMVRPVCGSCRSRHAVCTYSRRRRKPGPPKGCQKGNRSCSNTSSAVSSGSRMSGGAPSLSLSLAEEPGRLDEVIANSIYTANPAEWLLMDNDAVAEWPTRDNRVSDVSPHYPIDQSFLKGCPGLSPELEAYLLDLYFTHFQPIYPLFRHPYPCLSNRKVRDLSPRLKMAIYAVSARFASPEVLGGLASSKRFAQLAMNLNKGSDLTMDELKASILLYVYEMSESMRWDTVVEIARITRMAELYYALHFDTRPGESSETSVMDDWMHLRKRERDVSSGHDAEEWNSVWWCIYSLDTSCSAVASFSNAITDTLQAKMALPAMSVSEFTNPSLFHQESSENGSQFIKSSAGAKHWETMSMIFSKASCRNRNLYFGASSLMRAVTDLRSLIIRGRGCDIQKRLNELESDCTATSFALPPWFFNPTRNLGIAETDEEHQNRLNALLVWSGANVLLSICAAKISSHSAFSELQELQVLWLTILSKANETVLIVQNWKPGYFKAIDPMCSYLILLAASVLAFDGELSAPNASTPYESSEHLDLLQLFLDQVGNNWPLACRLANTLKSLRSRLLGRKPTQKDALNYLFQLTSPLNGTLMSSAEISGDTQPQIAEEVPTFRFPSVSDLIVPEDSTMHFNGELPNNVDPQLQNYQWLDDFDLASLDNVTEGMDLQLSLQHL
ncbi:Zn(2)-C6 fungal-type domain-containing protein [Fusarium sp. LHS14.1]|nr:Zn(2)-C6 fungal-type domain-containing protein [Fusarium sp. LHS14.1]